MRGVEHRGIGRRGVETNSLYCSWMRSQPIGDREAKKRLPIVLRKLGDLGPVTRIEVVDCLPASFGSGLNRIVARTGERSVRNRVRVVAPLQCVDLARRTCREPISGIYPRLHLDDFGVAI